MLSETEEFVPSRVLSTLFQRDRIFGRDRSEPLCSKDNKHHSTKCKPVQQLAAGVMERVNAKAGTLPEADPRWPTSGLDLSHHPERSRRWISVFTIWRRMMNSPTGMTTPSYSVPVPPEQFGLHFVAAEVDDFCCFTFGGVPASGYAVKYHVRHIPFVASRRKSS